MKPVTTLSWRSHAILVALVALQLVWAWIGHRSSEVWSERWRTGNSAQRLQAAHVLLNRGAHAGSALGARLGERLLQEERDPGVRSLAFSSDVCKLEGPRAQIDAVVAGLGRGEVRALVDFVLQCRKVGGEPVGASSAMSRVELAWYYDGVRREREAAPGATWPPAQQARIDEHLAPFLASLRAWLERNPRED